MMRRNIAWAVINQYDLTSTQKTAAMDMINELFEDLSLPAQQHKQPPPEYTISHQICAYMTQTINRRNK